MKILNKNQLKILQINPYPPEKQGGSELFTQNLTLNLNKKENFKSEILTSNFFRVNGKKEHRSGKLVPVIYKRFYASVWKKNPIVNTFSFLSKYYLNYDIIHIHSYFFFTSIQSALLKKIKKFPLVLHIHGGIQHRPSNIFKFKEKAQIKFKNYLFDKLIGKIPIRAADAIISVTQKELNLIQKIYKVKENKCFYIPNGINTNDFKKNINKKRIYITFVGRLTYIKGLDIFLKIIKELYHKNENLKFLIVGNGQLEGLVLKAKKKLPITYYPYWPHKRMVEIYNLSKMVLITSRYEGLPTILLESLGCETPVIASNVGGISEVIKPNVNGFLFDIERYKDVVDIILDLIESDKRLEEIGKEGRNSIIEKFSWDFNMNKIIEVYKKIYNNH